MTADGLRALFAPLGAVAVKPMFGGHGVFSEGLCFAIEIKGEVFLKADAQLEPSFAAAGSSPFVYNAKGRPISTSFWRLPAAAHDDDEELGRWIAMGLSAARRAAETKSKSSKKGAPKAAKGGAKAK
jgi:DNA transformation protein and related proteins